MTFLLDAPVSRYRRPLKIRDFGRDPFNQNFRKFWSKTRWIGSVQPEKFRINGSTVWGGPLFPVGPVGILVEWIAPFVWEIKYWDLRTLNNVKSNFSFNEMNKKDLPAMYSTVFRCLLVVLLCFLALLHNHYYSLHKTKSRMVTSIWQGPGPIGEIQVCCKCFQLQPKRETPFSSLSDRLEKNFIISPSNWTICAGLWGTSGFRPVPVTAVALTN